MFVTCTLLLSFAISNVALSQSAVTGVVYPPKMKPLVLSAPDENGVVWQDEYKLDGSTFTRVEISDVSYHGSALFEVRVIGYSGKILEQIEGASLVKSKRWVSGDLQTDDVVVQIHTEQKVAPIGLSFNVSGLVMSAAPPPTPFGITSAGDDRKPISDYKDKPIIFSVARSVARLSILSSAAVGGRRINESCTGFLISNDLLVTNAHCISRQADCLGTSIYFGNEEVDDGSGKLNVREGERYTCARLIDADPSYELDYAILKLSPDGNGKKPGITWGYLLLDDRDPGKLESLIAIGHPNGEPKQVSATVCKALTVPAPGYTGSITDFGHICATTYGSSGSPVLDQGGHVVGLHHMNVVGDKPPWNDQNRAVRMHGRLWKKLNNAIAAAP